MSGNRSDPLFHSKYERHFRKQHFCKNNA